MGKKGIKKKTIWRTLSIGDITPTSTNNGNGKEIKKDYKTSIKIDLTTQPNNQRNGKLSSTSSELSNNENRNSFNTNNNYNYNKYNNDSSSAALPNSASSQSQPQYNKTYLPYKRRPFSSKSLNYNNYYSNNNNSSSAGGNNYRSNYRYRINNYNNNNSDSSNNDSQLNKSVSSEKKESNFNEDEYTRITTPRQDVLFKKGYLSKPKKYLKYNDVHTPSSSGAMSVISTEESTTTSTQSVTPENFNSIPENPDESDFSAYPYQSFIDQNGLFYLNPYIFDPYGGQMFMMPYPTSANCQQPFNTKSFDIYDNSQITTTSTSPVSFNQNNDSNTELNENSSPTTEVSANMDKVDKVTENISTEEIYEEIIPTEENITVNEKLEVDEEILLENQVAAVNEEKDENLKPEDNDENAVLDYPNDNASYFNPYMYYPYYYCPPQSMYPVNDLSYTNGFGIPYDTLGNKFFKYKKRKRKPRKTLNSSGVTTDDCSDDESTDNENHHSHHYIPFATTQTSETTKCYLNVEVEEFQPKCYTPKTNDISEKPSSIENISFLASNDYDDNLKTLSNSDVSNSELTLCPNSTPFVPNYSNVLKMESKDINKKTAINNINLNNKSLSNKAKKKNNKKAIPKPAAISSENKKNIIQESPSNEPTYAQMLNGGNKVNMIKIPCEIESKPIEIVKNETTVPTKVVTPKKIEKWQTVIKSKGKRGKNIHLEEEDVVPEMPNEDEIIEIQSEANHHDTINTNIDRIISTTTNEEDVLILNTSSNISSPNPSKKSSSLIKPKPKSKSSKKNPKRKTLQGKSGTGFEVIEPTFAPSIDSKDEQDQQIDETPNTLAEFDSFIEEVQDVINGDVEIFIDTVDINEDNFTNFDFNETDELDKDFDIIEKNENNNNKKEETSKIIIEANPPIEHIVEKVVYDIEQQDIMPILEKEILIDLDEELKNGCAIENKINGQVEEIIEKITVNEIESICNKIEEELSIDDNHVVEEVVAANVVSPNSIEDDIGDNNDIVCTKLNDLCDKNQEETEKNLLSNNVKENVVTVMKENIYVKENGLSTNVKFPLTEAVTKWLFEKENQKTTITEPLLRLPNDPILSSKIQLMILSRTQYYHDDDHDDDDDWTTESETELEHDDVHKAKNFISNPLPVSSHNSSNEDINNISIIDTDSDYMSDSQIRADDNTRKRVAASKNYDSDTTITANNTTMLSSNNQSKLSSKSLDTNSTKIIDKKCIKLPFTDVCCVLM